MSSALKVSRTFAGEMDQIQAVYEFISEAARSADLPDSAVITLEMAADEIFNNIVNYAYPDGRDKWVTVEIRIEDGTVLMTFTDCGVPFDPSSAPAPDISKSAGEREIGGLGIHIVRSTMDGITYSREDGKNVLTVAKKI